MEGDRERLTRQLENLSVDEPIKSPRSSSSYTNNINADIQARLLAFQEQRQAKGSPTSESNSQQKEALQELLSDSSNAATKAPGGLQRSNSTKDKPLPPLPGSDTAQKPFLSTSQVPRQAPPLPPSAASKLNPARHAPSLPINSQVSPQVAARLPKTKQSLSMRRGMKLPGGLPTLNDNKQPQDQQVPLPQGDANSTSSTTSSAVSNNSNTNLNNQAPATKSSVSEFIDKKGKLPPQQSMQLKGLFANYSKYIDIKSGSLNFAGKLSLDSKGVNFNGTKFNINADDLEFMEELGRGNYGTVSKVIHKPTGIVMAMKEVRLELDDSKFRQILMELEVLHKCNSPYIVDFYGAFFVEGAVYMCIEYMDGNSLDKIYGSGIDEPHLAYITDSVIKGLKELKENHNIIHRDVKPTNILVNTAGKVKLCDFGVSGNLVASLAKTNIGCQSYMAPERIKSLSPDDVTYTVQSDIWSLGLTILESAKGSYPYPPETYDNIFSQLSAIVDGEPPSLPEGFGPEAHDFVNHCLDKIPERRPNYTKLLQHPWLSKNLIPQSEMAVYVTKRIEERKLEKGKQDALDIEKLNEKLKTPALHRGGAPQK